MTGLVLLGYLGWQIYGTTWVSQRRHAQTVEQLEEAWARPGGSAGVRTEHGLGSAVVRIPALGTRYAVPVLEGVDDDALASGLGHFPDSAAPGGEGNYALAGHRVTHGEPLRDLDDLEPGDEVVVETRDEVYTYVLDTGGGDLRVPFTETWVLDPRPVDPSGRAHLDAASTRILTLTTCAELFATDDRWVVFGHLVSAEPR